MKISIKKIIENMPKDLTNIEKVRYIYLKIGNIFAYQREYLNIVDYRAIRDMYNRIIRIEEIEEGNYENKIVSTCKQTAEVEADTINMLNCKDIKARTVGYVEDDETHVAVVATVDNKDYYLDISPDLYRIQKNMKTVRFARSSAAIDGTKCEKIPDEELEKIDDKLGYREYGMYMDDVFAMIKEEMLDEETWKKYIKEDDLNTERKEDIIFRAKIDFIFKVLKNNSLKKDKLQVVEIDKYYQKLFKTLLTQKEKKNKIKSYHIFIKDKNNIMQESLFYEIEVIDKKLYYLYTDEEKGFIPTNFDELKEMYKNGDLKNANSYYKLGIEEDIK